MKSIANLETVINDILELVKANCHNYGNPGEYGSNSVNYNNGDCDITVNYEIEGKWNYDRGDYWTPSSYDLFGGEVLECEIEGSIIDDNEDWADMNENDLLEIGRAVDGLLAEIIK